MIYRITTVWGPNAKPYEQRRNEDVETLDDSLPSDRPDGMLAFLGGLVIASTVDGGVGTRVTIEVLS